MAVCCRSLLEVLDSSLCIVVDRFLLYRQIQQFRIIGGNQFDVPMV